MYENYEYKIYEGVYEACEKYGFNNLTTKIISLTCGVSEGSFYRHFTSKEDLLKKAYDNIDREIAKLLSKCNPPKTKYYRLIPKSKILKFIRVNQWNPFFQFLIDNPKKALFYIEYVNQYGDNQDQITFDIEDKKEYYKEYGDFIISINNKTHTFDKISPQIIWTSIIETTLIFAKKIILNKIPDTKENRDAIFNMIFHGVCSIF